MEKQKLINKLLIGIKTEESAVAIYAKHLYAIIERSDLEAEKIKKIKLILSNLDKVSVSHSKILKSILSEVKESDQNDF